MKSDEELLRMWDTNNYSNKKLTIEEKAKLFDLLEKRKVK